MLKDLKMSPAYRDRCYSSTEPRVGGSNLSRRAECALQGNLEGLFFPDSELFCTRTVRTVRVSGKTDGMSICKSNDTSTTRFARVLFLYSCSKTALVHKKSGVQKPASFLAGFFLSFENAESRRRLGVGGQTFAKADGSTPGFLTSWWVLPKKLSGTDSTLVKSLSACPLFNFLNFTSLIKIASGSKTKKAYK